MKIFDVIRYEGPNNEFVWKFPGEDFNTLSQLTVHESQEAVFFQNGKAMDVFGPGNYTLNTQNIPILRRFINLPFNGISPFHCEVYFINKVTSMDVMWGTTSDMPIQDAVYKIILPVRAHGQFAVKVTDSRKLLVSLVGTINQFDQQALKRYFKGILLTNIKDYIAKQFVQNQVSFLEIHSHIKDISAGIHTDLAQEFSKYGIELVNFTVNEIAPPEDDPSFLQLKKALAKKAEMEVMGYNYQQERTFNLLDKAAKNEGMASGIMTAGMGMGMGVNLGNAFGTAMTGVVANAQTDMSVIKTESAEKTKAKLICEKCGKELPEEAKFCFFCGAKIDPPVPEGMMKCPKCGEIVPEGKFCISCGQTMVLTCKNCGAVLQAGAKFCLECGTKAE